MRRLAYPLIGVLLISGCATRAYGEETGPGLALSTSAGPSPEVTVSPPATCPPEGVRLEAGDHDAAMGLRVQGISLINCGTEPYEVGGYPDVVALAENGAELDVQVLDGLSEIASGLDHLDVPPQTLVLQPGERAGATLAWRNRYDDISAPPVLVPMLSIAPQAGRPARTLTLEGGLDLGNTGRFGVSVWRVSPPPPNGAEQGPTPTPPPPTAPTQEPTSRPLL